MYPSHLSSKIRVKLFDDATAELTRAHVLPGLKYDKQGLSVAVVFLQEGQVSYKAYRDPVGDVELANKLLESNVFSHRFYSDMVSFQSAPMRQYHDTIYE